MKNAAQCLALVIAVTAAATHSVRADDNFILGIGVGTLGRLIDDPSKRTMRSNEMITRLTGESGSAASVKYVQTALKALGYDVGTPDGFSGPRTRNAIKSYQRSIGAEPTGTLDNDQVRRLVESYVATLPAEPRRVSPTRGHRRQPSAPTAAASTDAGIIKASRLFAGPEDYPPTDFAAYGILAFKSRASTHDRPRHLMICDAFLSSIQASNSLPTPRGKQMVTIWPMVSGEAARAATRLRDQDACGVAVDQYGSMTAASALRQAASVGANLDGIGPYLLAWSPPQKKGQPDAIVLAADLSSVENYEDALNVMWDWVHDIEQDPQLWAAEEGWTVEGLRVKVRQWFDRRGTQLLSAVAGKTEQVQP